MYLITVVTIREKKAEQIKEKGLINLNRVVRIFLEWWEIYMGY